MSENIGGFASRVGEVSGWLGKKLYKGAQIIAWDHETNSGSVFVASGIDQHPDRGYDWKKVGGFVIRDYEMGVILQNGKYVGDLAAGMYKLEKKMKAPGCEIIWLSKQEFKILWGTGNVYTSDNLMVGGFGVINIRLIVQYIDVAVFGRAEGQINNIIFMEKHVIQYSSQKWYSCEPSINRS